jgi:hypothetical protein
MDHLKEKVEDWSHKVIDIAVDLEHEYIDPILHNAEHVLNKTIPSCKMILFIF